MTDENCKHKHHPHLSFQVYLVIFSSLLLASAIFLLAFSRCSIEPTKADQGTPSPQCSDGLGIGQTITKNCADGELGETVYLCKTAGAASEIQSNSCKTIDAKCDKITFEDQLKPILSAGGEDSCISCHSNAILDLTKYEVVSTKIDEIIRRIYLSEGNNEHMPQFKKSLPLDQKQTFEKWKSDGLLKDKAECNKPLGGARSSINKIEIIAEADLRRVDKSDRINTRYCQASASVRTEADMIAIKKALDKTLTGVDDRNIKLALTTVVNPEVGLFRFDIVDYDISRQQWVNFENAEPLNFVSKTDAGTSLRLFTAANKPIVHCENLIDVVNTNAALYYDWLNVPPTFNELMIQQGVQFANDIRNFNASFLGFNGSVISLNKNRLLIRHRSTFGYMWNSQDTKALNNIRNRNILLAPLVVETGSLNVFDYAAGETIWTNPNGSQGYALHDRRGTLQIEAPTDVVIDTTPGTRISPQPTIAIASSCSKCHASGILIANDQVRERINLAAFNSTDKNFIERLYKSKISNDANFLKDNKQFHEYLTKVGINPADPDPIHSVRVVLRSDWSAAKVASYLGLGLGDFIKCVEESQSDRVRDEMFPVIRGGTATYDSVVGVFGKLIEECQVAEEIQN